MIKKTYNTVRSLRSVLASILMLVSASVMADEVSINSIIVDKDETVTVDVNFDMSNYVVGLQMFIDLPKGIEFVTGGVTRNSDRISRDTHDFQYNVVNNDNGTQTLKVLVLPTNGDDAIEGTSGTLFSFVIKSATDDVNDVIEINNIMESTIDNGKLKSVKLADESAEIASKEYARILNVVESMTVKEGETNKQKVSVNLVNGFDVYGMQFTVSLPKGLTPETNSKGRIVFTYGDRLPEDFSIKSNTASDGSVKVVISSMTGAVINNKKSGEEVLSFNVIADNTLAESSEIVFSKAVVSNSKAESLSLNDCKVKVTNQTAIDRRINGNAYDVLDPQLKGVQEKYDEAVKTIAAYTTTDAKSIATGKEATEIDSLLKVYRTQLDEANKALSVKNTDSIAAVYTALDGRVDALLTSAQTTETNALKANEDTYATLDTQLKTVLGKYTSAVGVLVTYKTEEGKAYATSTDVADIDSLLKVYRAELDSVHAALALRSADSLATVYKGIDTRITTLASAAEKAETAALKLNADSYKILDSQLKNVQTRYNSALAVIDTYKTEEGRDYTSNAHAAEVDSLMKAYRTSLDGANAAYSLRATETTLADYTTLDAKITALSSAASVAESKALQTNTNVYSALNKQLNAVEVKYTSTVKTIAAYKTAEGKEFATGTEATEVDSLVKAYREDLDAANSAFVLRSTDSLATVYKSLDTRIATLSSSASTAESNALKLNADTYTTLDTQLKSVLDNYNSAIKVFAAYKTAEGKAFATGKDVTDIASLLKTYRTELDAANTNLKLRSTDSLATVYKSLDTRIATLSSSASTAESNALKLNADTYTTLDTQLKSVLDNYNSAIKVFAAYKTAEGKAFATGKDVTDIASLLKTYRTELDAANTNLKLRSTDSLATVYKSLDTRIATLSSSASTAESNALKLNADTYTTLDTQLKSVQNKLTSAVSVFAAYTTEEGRAFATGIEVADIDSLLKVYRAELDAANTDLELRSTSTLATVYKGLETRIATLASTAATAESNALKANTNAYTALDKQLQAVQTRYNSALAVIETYKTEEGKAYTSNADAAEVDSLLKAYRTSLDEAYKDLSLRNTEKVLADYTTLDAKVVALSSAASVAESTALKTNAEVYNVLTAKLGELETLFETLVDSIKSYTTDEAKALADGEDAQAISEMISDLELSVDNANAAYTLRDSSAYDNQLGEIAQAVADLKQLAADTEKEYFVTPGEVNGDGEIDITDATATISFMLEEEPENFKEKAADVNGDGEVDVTDVALIINMILTLIK